MCDIPSTPSILTALGIEIQIQAPVPAALQEATAAELTHAGHLPVRAHMTVDERTMHPFGALSGGASLALAECLAGYASRLFCQEHQFPTGQQVSGHHVATAHAGERLVATATFVHKGRKTHIWNIDITNAQGKLISSVRVTNLIITTTKTE